MIDLTVHKKFKYVLFSGLYAAEGLYMAMLTVIIPLYLLEKNVPIPIISLVGGIGYLPWALKFVWGGIIDFYHKYGRKKFTVFGTFIGAIGFLILALIDQYFSIIFFTIFLFIGHMGIGFLDAATDAWGIDVTEREERGKVNGSMNIGKSVGQFLGIPVLVVIGVTFGYNISFLITGLVIMFLALVPLSAKYEDRKIGKINIWPLLKKEFGKKITRITTLYFFIVVLHPSLYFSILAIYLKIVLNLDDMFIGLIFAFWLIAVIPGSIVGGILADKYGRKLPLYLFLLSLIFFSITPIFLVDIYIIILNFTILMFFTNGIIAANWALIMDIINPKIGAAEHEVICSIVNFGSVVIASIAGTLFVLIGIQNMFLLSAIIIVIALLVLYRLKNIDKIKWKSY